MTDENPDRPDAEEFPQEFTASSLTGSIVVRTAERGLPLGIRIEPDQLQREPDTLANEILRLCKKSAGRAGLARREYLEQAGYTPEMLSLAGLPTKETVARQEIVEEQEYETQPDSWLRSV
ncbi:hypothetical protein [Nocardia sp. BMG51109]|uniref:hypothetical protein n=1 Tax=Nocardia sp. BMG51109 TaxID=1056816 RepID=UPI00046516C6|nr:hypothetical protein [Nocardia sp. BMG51109]